MKLPRIFRPPSYLEVAAQQLDEAQRTSLEAAKSREYYAAMEVMLAARIARLQAFIAATTATQPTSDPLP